MSTVWFGDLTKCAPGSALSKESRQQSWRAIEYEAEEISGVLVSASPGAPDLTLPLDLEGWHAVYIGIWGSEAARVKLTSDPSFRRLVPEGAGRRGQTIEEGFLKYADLTGQKLVIAADANGPFGAAQASSSVAYVRCEPLAEAQVEAVRRDRQPGEHRRLIATNDGECVTNCRSEEDIREYIEPFRDSDFWALYWGVVGEFATHPTKVGTERYRDFGGNSGGTEIVRKGINALRTAMEYAHSIGLSFHLYQRMGAFGSAPPIKYIDGFFDDLFTGPFYKDHPEWRCVDRDGRPLLRMSYAYSGVRQFGISILREAAEYGIDGVNLQFKRGAPFVMYEPPLIEGFKEETGLDARELDEWDERWLRYRSRPMTEFVRDLRKELDQVGQGLGKSLELSAGAFPAKDENLFFGIDLETWIEEDLIDALTPMSWSHTSREVEMDYYVALTRGTKCRLQPFLNTPKNHRTPRYTAAEYRAEALRLYEAGAEGLVFWDEVCQETARGAAKRRLGHIEELRAWGRQTTHPQEPRVIELRSLGGRDLTRTAIPTNYGRIYKSTLPYWFLPG